MKELTLRKYPDPILNTVCMPVEEVNEKISNQVHAMLDLMYDSGGVGLAANQAGETNRVIVMDCSEDQDDPICLINPIIKSSRGEVFLEEGCLSFPGVVVSVQRFEKIKVEFTNLGGDVQTKTFEGLDSICVQHEIDHLDGKTFLDKVNRKARRSIMRKARKIK